MPNLYVYYSFSGRTQRLIQEMARQDPTALVVRLETVEPLQAPISTPRLFWYILKARGEWRIPIRPLAIPDQEFACLTLGSPTWGGKPAGPVLSFLERDLPGIRFKKARYVISCRRSWQENARYLEERVGQPLTGRVVGYDGNLIQSYLKVWRDLCRRPFEKDR